MLVKAPTLNKRDMSMRADMLSGKQRFRYGPQGSLVSVDESSVSSADDYASDERMSTAGDQDEIKLKAVPVVDRIDSYDSP